MQGYIKQRGVKYEIFIGILDCISYIFYNLQTFREEVYYDSKEWMQQVDETDHWTNLINFGHPLVFLVNESIQMNAKPMWLLWMNLI